MHMKMAWLERLPAGLFAIPYSLFGLSGAWRRAAVFEWPLAPPASSLLLTLATCLWAVLLLCYAAKCLLYPTAVQREFKHPVQGALLSLLPLSILLAAVSLGQAGSLLWLLPALLALMLQGLVALRVITLMVTGQMPSNAITPALYLPPVAGGLIGGLSLASLGYPACGALLFGVGLAGWALLEMRVLGRLFEGPLPEALRPTMGVELAPAPVATLAAAVIWPQLPADVLLIGLGIGIVPIVAVLVRYRWWSEVPFSAGFWSFGFPLAALAAAVTEVVRRGGLPPYVAGIALLLASVVIAFLVLRTVMLVVRGKLLPAAALS